jgi:exopolysaccharide biosynthesis polyprenyl glycosylphosphotransferase
MTLPAARSWYSLRLSERKLLLFGLDTLAVTLALLATLALRLSLPFGWHTIGAHASWFGLLIGEWFICAPLIGLYDLRTASRVSTGVATAAVAAFVVAVAYLFTPVISPPLLYSRLTAATFAALMVGIASVGRTAYARLLVQPSFRHRVLIVGAGWAGRELVEALRTHAANEYDVTGFVDDDSSRLGSAIGDVPVMGTSADLGRLVDEHRVSEVIVAVVRHETLEAPLLQAVIHCHECGIQVTLMQTVFERLTGKVPVEHAGKSLHVLLPTDRDSNRVYLVFKRGTDILFGLAGSLVTLAVLPLVALAVRLESRGPVFYRQVRVGQGGRLFTLVKFRTMIEDAEAAGPMWAQEGDERVTRVGGLLRRLHIDELPQAFSIVRGEMSLVGPRPERPEFVNKLETKIAFYRARHAMRPGLTGWAQVNYRYGRSTEDAMIKLQYDLYYIKHCSLFLDGLILVKTIGLVLTGRGVK